MIYAFLCILLNLKIFKTGVKIISSKIEFLAKSIKRHSRMIFNNKRNNPQSIQQFTLSSAVSILISLLYCFFLHSLYCLFLGFMGIVF